MVTAFSLQSQWDIGPMAVSTRHHPIPFSPIQVLGLQSLAPCKPLVPILNRSYCRVPLPMRDGPITNRDLSPESLLICMVSHGWTGTGRDRTPGVVPLAMGVGQGCRGVCPVTFSQWAPFLRRFFSTRTYRIPYSYYSLYRIRYSIALWGVGGFLGPWCNDEPPFLIPP